MKTTNETYKVRIYVSNVLELYKMLESVANCLRKKINKGIEIDAQKLVNSSVIANIVREANKYLQKYDDETLSTQARKESKEIISNIIIEMANEF